MHKMRLNELSLHAILQPDGPLLIKSGTESGADPTLPSMNFVRTRHPDTGERTIYLPGSSLKGTFRSHIERIIRTVYSDNDPTICCDPLGNNSCGRRIDKLNEERKYHKEDPLSTAEEYRELCLACRIFGHTAHASHFVSADAYPLKAIDVLPVRQGVAINRFSGGVGVGPFEMEVATTGRFHLRLMLTNFEVWQVGLLALALRDMSEGRLLVGFAKSRGLGKVKLQMAHLEIAYPGHFEVFDPTPKIFGTGALAAGLVEPYSLVANDSLELPEGSQAVPDGQTWGRPAVTFGLKSPELIGNKIDKDELKSANLEVLAALAVAVPAWAAYQKPNLRPGALHG